MNDNDELNDSAVLSAVRDSIAGLPMPAAPVPGGHHGQGPRAPALSPGRSGAQHRLPPGPGEQ